MTSIARINTDGRASKKLDLSDMKGRGGVHQFIIVLNMSVVRSFLNDSLSDSAIYACRSNIWIWLSVHVIYSVGFSATISASLYHVGSIWNFGEPFDDPYVHLDQLPDEQEAHVAMTHAYRPLKSFLVQLTLWPSIYVLAAYCYRSIAMSTSTGWLSLARWIIEATCDLLHITSVIGSFDEIPARETVFNRYFSDHANILLIIRMNQFVMMRYAEFHPHACVNTIPVLFFSSFCPKLDGYSLERMLAVCVFPRHHLPDFRK
jgi:hypothetical protein